MTGTQVVLRPWHTLEAGCLAPALREVGLAAAEHRGPATAAAVLMQARGHPERLGALAEGLDDLPMLLIVDVADPRTVNGEAPGAAGVVSWVEDPRAVVRAVREVARGKRLHTAIPTDRDPCRRMTDRELDVLALVALGRRDEEIGDTLGISVNTVRTHVKHALMKLDVGHRRAAAALARGSALVRARQVLRTGGSP